MNHTKILGSMILAVSMAAAPAHANVFLVACKGLDGDQLKIQLDVEDRFVWDKLVARQDQSTGLVGVDEFTGNPDRFLPKIVQVEWSPLEILDRNGTVIKTLELDPEWLKNMKASWIDHEVKGMKEGGTSAGLRLGAYVESRTENTRGGFNVALHDLMHTMYRTGRGGFERAAQTYVSLESSAASTSNGISADFSYFAYANGDSTRFNYDTKLICQVVKKESEMDGTWNKLGVAGLPGAASTRSKSIGTRP